jgi:hypothetical protein
MNHGLFVETDVHGHTRGDDYAIVHFAILQLYRLRMDRVGGTSSVA